MITNRTPSPALRYAAGTPGRSSSPLRGWLRASNTVLDGYSGFSSPAHLLLRSARAVKCLQAAARRTIFARAAAKLRIQRLAKAPHPMRNWLVGLDPAGRLLYQSALGGVPQLTHPSGVSSPAMLSAAGELLPPRWPSPTSGWFIAPELLGGFCFFRPSDNAVSWHPPADDLAAPPSPLPRLPFRQPPQHAGASVATPPEPWVVRYRGEQVCYLNQRTGALRRGPWVCLHEPVTGRIYAFDPKSGESSWVTPYGWMEGWIHRPKVSLRDTMTPRERIPIAEAALEIGGAAQWGTGVAPWDDLSDVESRVLTYLSSMFPEVVAGASLAWAVWKGASMHSFGMSERVLGAGNGVRDHALVREYEESLPCDVSHKLACVPTSDCVSLISRHMHALGALPSFLA